MRDTRRFVDAKLKDLSALWAGDLRIAREEIAKHVQKITLKPMLRAYAATGTWDWLAVLGGAAAMVVPGARITRRVYSSSAFHWRRKQSTSMK